MGNGRITNEGASKMLGKKTGQDVYKKIGRKIAFRFLLLFSHFCSFTLSRLFSTFWENDYNNFSRKATHDFSSNEIDYRVQLE